MSAANHLTHTWLNGDDHTHRYHLGMDGGDVSFNYYEQGTQSQFAKSRLALKSLILHGNIQLISGGKHLHLSKGDWFEIPKGEEHYINCLTDCSLIEFRYNL